MPDSFTPQWRIRRFLLIAKRVLGLVLLILKIVERWLELIR